MSIYFAASSEWQHGAGVSSSSAGKVNKVTTMHSASTGYRNGSETNFSAYNMNVTPVSSSSRIIVHVNMWGGCGSSWYGVGFRLKRNGSLLNNAASGNRQGLHGGAGEPHGGSIECYNFFVIDHPNTSNQVQYQIYGGNYDSDGELYIGRTQDDNNSAEFNRFATNMVAYDVTV